MRPSSCAARIRSERLQPADFVYPATSRTDLMCMRERSFGWVE